MIQRLAVFLGIAVSVAFAQQTGITGRITDPSGATVTTAIVTVTRDDGSKVETLTNAQGIYQFPTLRAAKYVLRVEAAGFSPAERTLTVLVGQMAGIDLALQVASASTSVSVMSEAGAVDTATSAIAGDVSPSEVSKMPLNGRNYLQLAMLVPGITSNDVTNSPLGATDSGKLQINVDGQQVTQNSASDAFGEPQYSQDAIDQFQIITNRFDATLGRSSRMQVNVQTKSGTNQYHGTLYGYFRNDAFNAADSVAHRVLPFSDQQFGGTVGGPILKDRLFFFFAYEGERQPNSIFDTPTGFGGQSYTFANELRTNSYLLHADWAINSKNRLSVRATGYTWHVPFNSVTGSASPTRATDSTRTSYAVLGTWTSTISAALVNEVKVGLNHFDWQNTPLIQSQEYRLPTITVGAPYNYPQQLGQNDYQYRDDLFWLKGGHSFKVGADYLHNVYSGNFGQNVRGTVLAFSSGVSSLNLASIFPTWNDPSTWNIAALSPYATSFTQGFGNYNYSLPTNAVGVWFEDDWKVSPKLTLNLGLRYDNDLGIFNPNLTLKSGVVTPHYNDNLLFQPRVGFAWDPTGSRKTVIRGGAGAVLRGHSGEPDHRRPDLQRADHHLARDSGHRGQPDQPSRSVGRSDRRPVPFRGGAGERANDSAARPARPDPLFAADEHRHCAATEPELEPVRGLHPLAGVPRLAAYRRQPVLQPGYRVHRQPEHGRAAESELRRNPEFHHAGGRRVAL